MIQFTTPSVNGATDSGNLDLYRQMSSFESIVSSLFDSVILNLNSYIQSNDCILRVKSKHSNLDVKAYIEKNILLIDDVRNKHRDIVNDEYTPLLYQRFNSVDFVVSQDDKQFIISSPINKSIVMNLRNQLILLVDEIDINTLNPINCTNVLLISSYLTDLMILANMTGAIRAYGTQ